MRIYVSHSSSHDFQKELYQPLRTSELNTLHEITLPHEYSTSQFDSKEYMKDCNLILAEVSYPSTGQGIELGWANAYAVPILCFHKKGIKPSGSLSVISDTLIDYEDSQDMIQKLTDYLSTFQNQRQNPS